MTRDTEAPIALALEDYDGSLRRKLILGVYIVSVTLVAILIYVINSM
ncbi:hypothetical protein [Shimia marina]|uniref:Uncharacterized protein n=1 Tax=Shimia marina TaxID=321267 RepID=A0A0P1ETB8_9RHOB|nr:hypothetical protein [Shimia marina]CUH53830.1 hypothetical protein SHM7688_03299 [Shimia marina]SFE21766.1 hypothetical protein SAMN04488037_106212 [Shimia marina]